MAQSLIYLSKDVHWIIFKCMYLYDHVCKRKKKKVISLYLNAFILARTKNEHFSFNVNPLYSGQSGSGKTEAAKLIVHYLSSMYQGRNDNLRQVV